MTQLCLWSPTLISGPNKRPGSGGPVGGLQPAAALAGTDGRIARALDGLADHSESGLEGARQGFAPLRCRDYVKPLVQGSELHLTR